MIIKNAEINTMAGPVTKNGYVKFNEKIIAVGKTEDLSEKESLEAFDAEGKMLFPGFVDAHTHLGILEDSIGGEGDDCNEESDPVSPQLRAADAANVADRCFDEALSAGITSVMISPGSASPIAGQIAAIKTNGKIIDQMIIKAPAAIKLALGENPKKTYSKKNAAPETRMATAAIIRESLQKAKIYSEDQNPKFDFKLEALKRLFTEYLPVHIHAHRADDIMTGVRIAEEFGLNYVIIHCTEGYKLAAELGKRNAKVCCGPLICDRSKPELSGLTPENPKILSENKVKTAIITDHPEVPVKYLPICAGLAVREGMQYEEALKAITINAAKICGISDRVGSIECGKDADLLLFEANPLSLEAKPVAVISDGVTVRWSLL